MIKRGGFMPEAFRGIEILTFPNVFMAFVMRCATSWHEGFANQVVISIGEAIWKGEYLTT